MNEEEKKAIELLENIKDDSWTTKYIMSSDSKNAEILLNLIEKLQKENEELKNEVMEKDLEIIGKEEYTKDSMGEIIEQYYTANEECIPIQKVKDKIEEEKLPLTIVGGRKNKKTLEYGIKLGRRQALQELIEEREEK